MSKMASVLFAATGNNNEVLPTSSGLSSPLFLQHFHLTQTRQLQLTVHDQLVCTILIVTGPTSLLFRGTNYQTHSWSPSSLAADPLLLKKWHHQIC